MTIISFTVISVLLVLYFLKPEKWMELCGVTIATASFFVMIVIMFLNNETINENTKKQIESFRLNIDSQIASFNKETEKQIESLKEQTALQVNSFKIQTDKIIDGLSIVSKTQEVTAEKHINSLNELTEKQIYNFKELTKSQIESFKQNINELIHEFEMSYDIQFKLTELSEKQTEVFIYQTNEIVEKLKKVASEINRVTYVSKDNTEHLKNKLDDTEPLMNKFLKKTGKELGEIIKARYFKQKR